MTERLPQRRSELLYGKDDPGVRTPVSDARSSSSSSLGSVEEIRRRLLEGRPGSKGRLASSSLDKRGSRGKQSEKTPLEKRLEEAADISNNPGIFHVAKDVKWNAKTTDSFKKDDFLIKQPDGKAADQVLFSKRGDSFHKPVIYLPTESAKSLMRIPWLPPGDETSVVSETNQKKKKDQDASELVKRHQPQQVQQPEGEEEAKAKDPIAETIESFPTKVDELMMNAPLDSALLEKGAWSAFQERRDRESANKEEEGAAELAEHCLQRRQLLRSVRSRMRMPNPVEDEWAEREAEGDVPPSTPNPYIPLPVVKKHKQGEVFALNQIGHVASRIASNLDNRLPFADYTWSRQPSFDDSNVDMMFRLDREDTLKDFKVTSNIGASHERVRLTAQTIQQLMSRPETDKRTIWWALKDVSQLYAPPPPPPPPSTAASVKGFITRDFSPTLPPEEGEDEEANLPASPRIQSRGDLSPPSAPLGVEAGERSLVSRPSRITAGVSPSLGNLSRREGPGGNTPQNEGDTSSPGVFPGPGGRSPSSALPFGTKQTTTSITSRLFRQAYSSRRTAGDIKEVPSRILHEESNLLDRFEKGPFRVSKKFTFAEETEEELKERRLLSFARSLEEEEEARRSMSLSIDIPPPPDSPPLPYYEQSVLIDWATRKDFNTSLEELEMDEEVERLRMLREIVCGIQKALGPLWERKIPPTSLLIPLLRRPYPYAISKQISDCGQCFLTKRLHVGKFWVEIYHSVWFPLIFERFNIFYTDFQSSSVYGWDPAVGITAWIYFTRNLPPLFRLANYLMTGALESRVAGLHRLLFRMNALEFFSYRISWSLHFNTYDSKAYDAPKEEELGRKDGSLDPVQMTRLATRLLRRLLKNSTACGAIRYNIEAIGLLWPYLIECREEDTLPTDKREGEEDEEKEHEEEVESVGKSTRVGKRPCLTKEEICRRIFTSPLTNAFFSVLADKQVPESPQAVHLIHAYFRLLTEFLYGARPAGFFEDLAASFHLPKGIPCIWTQLENAFHSDMTIFLLRDLLTFITDLLFLICGDEAPLPARNARHLRNKLEGVVLPLVKERRPDLANQETWDLVEENATCLRDALNTALRGGAIDPRLLKHFILPYRCKTGKASSPLRPPELRQTPWPSIMNLIPLPNSIPCWKPGCTKAFVLSEENSLDEKGQDYRYCEGCNVAAYCSKQCQVAHWLADHHRVCPYFRLPPTFMRFEMSAKKVPNSLAFPVFDIFKDTFDIYGPPCGKTTDNFSLIF